MSGGYSATFTVTKQMRRVATDHNMDRIEDSQIANFPKDKTYAGYILNPNGFEADVRALKGEGGSEYAKTDEGIKAQSRVRIVSEFLLKVNKSSLTSLFSDGGESAISVELDTTDSGGVTSTDDDSNWADMLDLLGISATACGESAEA